METNQHSYPFPTRFFVQVKENWILTGSDLEVGDVLMVEPYEDPKNGGLHYLRIGGCHVQVGWMYEHEGSVMFRSIFGSPRSTNLSEVMVLAEAAELDFAIYPIRNKVRLKDPEHPIAAEDGGAVNDQEPKGGSE